MIKSKQILVAILVVISIFCVAIYVAASKCREYTPLEHLSIGLSHVESYTCGD